METSNSTTQNLGFIDIGTNSIRLALVQISNSGAFTILTEQKETVRLGEGEFESHRLRDDAIHRAVLVCQKFAEMARNNNASEIIAVATSATREAKNRDAFLNILKKDAQLDVKVISGLEEARLIYLGISHGFDLREDNALMVDIGGGSTELIVGNYYNHLHLDSMKLGAIRVTSKFFQADKVDLVSPEMFMNIQNYVRNIAIRPIQRVQNYNYEYLIGSSGTIENLANLASYLARGKPLEDQEFILTEEIRSAIQYLCKLPQDERSQLPGFNPRRSDIIIGGSAILLTILEETNSPGLYVTSRTLRDGLIVDYLIRSNYAPFQKLKTVQERSVHQLAHKCGFDETHAKQVEKLALKLFDSGANIGLHDLKSEHRQLLSHAAILHDIGIFLSYSDHHKHGYYLIHNADLIGFNQNEIAITAATVYFHRKKGPLKSRPQLLGLSEKEKSVVKTLSTFVRIAEALDRSHQNVIHDVKISPAPNGTVFLDLYSQTDCNLEVWRLSNHNKLFYKVFKKQFIPRILDQNQDLSRDSNRHPGERNE